MLNFQKGYSLVELLVVIAAIAAITTVLIANFGTLKGDQSLESAGLEMQSLIRVAQADATTRVVCVSASYPSGQDGAEWFIEFRDSTTLKLGCINSVGGTAESSTDTSSSSKILKLKNGVTVKSIESPSCGLVPNMYVRFSPLYGTIVFSDTETAPSAVCFTNSSSFTVTLENSSGAQKVISIDKGGTINAN